MKIKNYLIKELILLIIFGITYCGIEILYRGRTHISMLFVGGLCAVLIGMINEITPKMNIILQMLIGAVIVTIIEFFSGYIINIILGLNVWDYSNLKFNILGQFSLLFAFLFLPLCLIAIILDDYIRFWFFKEEKPKYKLL